MDTILHSVRRSNEKPAFQNKLGKRVSLEADNGSRTRDLSTTKVLIIFGLKKITL